MSRLVLRQIIKLAALAIIAIPTTARACPADHCSHAAHLPSEVDVFVELNNTSREDWELVSTLAGANGAITDSWHELAKVLDTEDVDAFEKLLAQRVSIAIRGVWTGTPEWAAFFSTDERTASLIRERLGARPRKIVGGKAVLRLPGARYQLTEFRHPGQVTVMMAPTGKKGGLFYSACDPADDLLITTPRLQEIENQRPTATHFIALTLPDSDGWLSAGANINGPIVDLTMHGQLDDKAPPRSMINPDGWDELFQNAIFGVVERGGTLFDGKTGWPLKALTPLISAMGPSAGEVVAAVVKQNDQEIEFACAISTTGPEDRARKLDAGAARTIALISAQQGNGAWAHDFKGLAPKSLRTANVSDTLDIHWLYSGEGWQPGWVIGGTSEHTVKEIATTAKAEANAMRLRVTLDGEGWETMPMTAWRSIGIARPAQFISLLAAKGQALPGALARLSTIESIEWTVRDLPAGGVDGSFTITRSR